MKLYFILCTLKQCDSNILTRGDVVKVLIGGCRHYNDYASFCDQVKRIISEVCINDSIIIFSGHCSGVDMLGERYAEENGYRVELFPAEWDKYGRAAGPVRNRQMVEKAELVIAFWDGRSKGTRSLIGYAEKLHKTLRIVEI